MSETNIPQPAPVQPDPANPFQAPNTNAQQQQQQYAQAQYAPQPQKLGDQAGMRVLLPVGRSGWAIAAGYLGLLSPTLVIAPLAIIFSIIAMMDINKSQKTENKKHGMGRAVFGLVMGVIFTLWLLKWQVTGRIL